MHNGPENFKKSRQKNSSNQMNQKSFPWNCISGSFKLFPSPKIDFWPFLKLEKMDFGKKKFRQIGSFHFTSFFLPWTFLNFLAHSVITHYIQNHINPIFNQLRLSKCLNAKVSNCVWQVFLKEREQFLWYAVQIIKYAFKIGGVRT